MSLVEATVTEPIVNAEFALPDPQKSMGTTTPIVTGGRLYVREDDQLFCYNVREDALQRPPGTPRTVVLTVPQITAVPTSEKHDRTLRSVFVPTPQDVVEKMLELADVKKADVVYDLGSGDGRIVITAAKKYGSKAIGFEIDKELVELSRTKAEAAGVKPLVSIEAKDLFTASLGDADVVAVYLLPKQLEKLLPQFEKLKPGSRIVSHQFEIPGVKPDRTHTVESKDDGDKHTLHLWTTPLKRVPGDRP
jgi:precorrin-6B methylase 2